jgi:serpin B
VTRAPGDAVAQRAVVASVQAFTADVYERLASTPGNLVCSPYSIAVALAMTRNGARGRTAAEMDRVLHAPPLPRLNSGLNALTRQVESRAGSKKRAGGSSTEVAVGVANSLWGQHGMPWEPAFLDALARDYGAGLELVGLRASRRGGGPHQRVGRRADQEAHPRPRPTGCPRRADTPGARQRDVRQGGVEHPFERQLTTARPFTRADGRVVTVPTMSANGLQAERAVGAGWQAVRVR